MDHIDKKASTGQKAKFVEVYTRYYTYILSVVYQKVGSVDIAEDLTHDVFLKYLSQIDTVENIKPWLYAVSKRAIAEYYRKNKSSDDIVFSEDSVTTAVQSPDKSYDTQIILDTALENLEDEEDRRIFDLVAVQQYTFEDAGKCIGLSRYNLRYRYRIIMKNILGYLNSKGINQMADLL
ncbi:MAG: sigma-70 family RNA polymerase sigma factor [bacterium]|nr:sigma-70 family RNA polymerase sigma factor [bacterium]